MRLAEGKQAMIAGHLKDSFIALTYEHDPQDGYLFTTCLTANQISHLEPDEPLIPLLFHFGAGLPFPLKYNFNFSDMPARFIGYWKKKTLPIPVDADLSDRPERRKTWHYMAKTWRHELLPKLAPGQRLALLGNLHTTAYGIIEPGRNPPHPVDEQTYPLVEFLEKRKKKLADDAAAAPQTPAPQTS